MLLTHLSLTHFRNYRRLELDFTRRLTLLQGNNAQGKTSLLEAIYFLATSKPVHAGSEREVVDWHAQEEPIPYSRVAAVVQTTEEGRTRTLELEILLTPRGDGLNFAKQVRINGVNKRSLDLIGLLRAVLFLPEDMKLVDGSPGERRRYLDIALCQIDPVYTRTLAAYQKIVTQRNSLLKQLRDQGARPNAPATDAQLAYWDDQLVTTGSEVMARRHAFVAALQPLAHARHAELADGRELLDLEFLPSLNYGPWPTGEFDLWAAGHLLEDLRWPWAGEVSTEAIAAVFREQLAARRARELAAGMTLYGPHRDELRFLVNRRDLRLYGSRGQQRSAALSLKLAEVQEMTAATGAAPLLLLDDVMSELDARRRAMLLTVLADVPQAVITTTDWDDFAPDFRDQAQRLHVWEGTISEAPNHHAQGRAAG
jgi:DNA replication and repair protein RecF